MQIGDNGFFSFLRWFLEKPDIRYRQKGFERHLT